VKTTLSGGKKMKTEYAIMHKKDLSAPHLKENKEKREIYDKRTSFETLDNAIEFAISVLHEQPILMRSAALAPQGNEQVKYPDTPYVIAAYFTTKYSHYSYDGSSDYVPTHEIERCSRDQLEDKLMKIAGEAPDKLYWGIELKLIPTLEMFK